MSTPSSNATFQSTRDVYDLSHTRKCVTISTTASSYREMEPSTMPQPSKGDRRQTNMRLPKDVYEHIKGQADEAKIYVNECTADLLSIITGHPELVEKLPDVPAAAAALIAVLEPIAAAPPQPRQLDLLTTEHDDVAQPA